MTYPFGRHTETGSDWDGSIDAFVVVLEAVWALWILVILPKFVLQGGDLVLEFLTSISERFFLQTVESVATLDGKEKSVGEGLEFGGQIGDVGEDIGSTSGREGKVWE